jgi:hypothetical protein
MTLEPSARVAERLVADADLAALTAAATIYCPATNIMACGPLRASAT